MAELKLNKNEAKSNEEEVSYIKKEETQETRKIFANKKVNIALGILAVLVIGVYIAAFVL